MAVMSALASPQYLGFGCVVGHCTPRSGSTFPAYASDPSWAASSGRGLYRAKRSAQGRIRDYGVVYGGSSGYRPASYTPWSSKGRR